MADSCRRCAQHIGGDPRHRYCWSCGARLDTPSSLYRWAANGLYSGLLCVSLSELISKSLGERVRRIGEDIAAEVYAVVITALLAALLVFAPHRVSGIGIVALVVALYRWSELQTFGLGMLLKQQQTKTADVISVGVAGVGLSLSSAIVTLVLAHGAGDWTEAPKSALDAWYSSVSNLVVLGNGRFTPTSATAEAIVIATAVTGVILLAVYLTLAVSLLSRR